jgi:glyoxylase-like metal-dependent hydrolase (beta-lactamase superfamily II)
VTGFEPNVADGIHRIEDAYTNWYLVEGEGGLLVVDAGVPSSWNSLVAALDRLDRGADDVAAVVLTHAHFDHIGFAERAREELDVPVYVHEDDVPLVRRPHQYSHERARSRYLVTRPRALPIVASFLLHRAFWPTPVGWPVPYTNGQLPVPGTPSVLRTPGHTIGHCSLHFADRDCVIAGDALVMLDPYTAEAGPRIVAGAATADTRRNLRTLDAIAATGARVVLTGHGEPWRDGAEAAVAQARAAGVS